MKRIIVPLVLIFTVGVQSCKKDLVEKPYSTLSPVNVFTSESGLKQATLGIYQSWTATYFTADNPYGNIFDVIYRFTLTETGHQYAAPGVYGTAFMDPYLSFAQTKADGAGATVWQRSYLTVARANAVIFNANKAVSNSSVADVYIAEAKFNRAYAYFNLVRFFGGVPIINNEITSLAQNDLIYGPRASIEETYNFLIEDLKFAETKLPNTWSSSDKGRVSAGTAKAMLGKVYLTMAGKPLSKPEYFQKAVDKLKEVTNAAVTYNFGLVSDFKSIFSTGNEVNKEVVLAFRYVWASTLPNANLNPFFVTLDGLDPSGQPFTQTQFGLTYKFWKLYEPSDVRRDFTVVERYKNQGPSFPVGDSLIYDPLTYHYINKNSGSAVFNTTIKYGLGYGKFSRDARPSGALPWSYSDDLVEYRYADVLLCLAEALNETGSSSEALTYINMVRQRANASQYVLGSQDDLRQKIRNERKLELIGEGTTVHDIRRWGTLQQEMAAMSPNQLLSGAVPPYSAKLELYPIPLTEINANPTLTQNPGW